MSLNLKIISQILSLNKILLISKIMKNYLYLIKLNKKAKFKIIILKSQILKMKKSFKNISYIKNKIFIIIF